MGVKTCSKPGCNNIMCDTYVPEVGYVCTECQDDFVRYVFRKHKYPHIHNDTIIGYLKKYLTKERNYRRSAEDNTIKFDIIRFFNQNTN